MLTTESGWYISPVLGDGNIHGLPGCFWCSAISRSTASCGIEIFLIEFSVFGRVMSGSPALLRPACLLTEIVLFSMSKSDHCSATGSPFRNPLISSRFRVGNTRQLRIADVASHRVHTTFAAMCRAYIRPRVAHRRLLLPRLPLSASLLPLPAFCRGRS